jgi:hypothetical protein
MIVNILHHDLQGPARNNLIKATFPLMLSENLGIAFNQSKILKRARASIFQPWESKA